MNIPEIKHPLDDITEEAKQRFRVEDDGAAAWAMRKLRTIRSKQAENAQLYADELARLNLWLDEVNKPLDNDANYFESLLNDYAIRCRDNSDDGRKSLNLPTGKVTTRLGGPRWEVDSEPFLAWAKTNQPDLIRIKEEPNIQALKEFTVKDDVAITSDGEVIPGVRISYPEVSVTISPDIN